MKYKPRTDTALCSVIFAVAVLFAPSAAAQSRIEHINSREAFNQASTSLSTIDFGSVAPNRGFGMYRPPAGLTTSNISFRTTGGARFGPGIIYVPSLDYMGTNPLYKTGTGEMLSWSAPNQPGNASLDVTLPDGTTAVGADLWTHQPYVSTIDVTVTTEDGQSRTVVVNTRNRPDAGFVGFISDKSIVSVSFRPPKGQTGLLLDNFSYGRKARERTVVADAQPTAPAATEVKRPDVVVAPTTEPANRPPAANTVQTPARTETPARPSDLGSSSTPARGTIAYVRGGTEIRLIESDGTNDRRLWTHEYSKEGSGIYEVSWRPDGKELAFSSSHLSVASLYHADIYAISPEGKGYRKITNAPEHGDLARYPKGAVTVTVRNEQPIWKQSQASSGVFFVYVVGANEPQAVTLPPGSSKTLLFKSVADYGNHAQAVVAMYGNYRWFIPGLDVRAGQTVKSPDFSITGDGIELFGAFRPNWRADGSRLSYRSGLCVTSSVPAQPTPGEFVFQPLFAGKTPSGACTWDWGPTAALADQILYTSNTGGDGSSIYRMKEGGTHPGTKIHTFSELEHQLLLDLRWLPNGSGFLYSYPDLAYEFGNLFRYDFATKRVTQLTNFKDEYARGFDVSPDGAWIVFERAKKWNDDKDVDLWIMRADGSDMRLLVRGGLSPSWR